MKHSLLEDLLDLFYPALCSGCNTPLLKGESSICLGCKFELSETHFHKIKDNPIERIFSGRVPLEKATAFFHFVKNGRIQSILHHLKYNDKPDLGIVLGQWIGGCLNQDGFFDDIDYLLPVPLHPKKLKSRGYNQSEKLAEGMARSSGIPIMSQWLKREHYSQSQTKKSRFRRWLNVEDVFAINSENGTPEGHVLLIDDVVTTGSTVEAAAYELLKCSGVKVSFCSLAIA